MSPASLDEALVAAAQGGSTEAFSRLVERHQQPVRAWLCGIGYNKHLTAMRSAGRERARAVRYEADRPPPSEAAPEDRLALETAMAKLPAEQRACVALCLAADFSHAEAAEALAIPLGTVKSHISRGRARLLQALGVCDDAS